MTSYTKRLLPVLAAAAVALLAQDHSSEIKHQIVPTLNGVRGVEVSALEIVRDLPYNSIVHLKGNVEIKTPVCVRTGPGNAQTCSDYIVLRADQADFHEDTSQIDASGNVRVTREPMPDSRHGGGKQ